MPTSFDDLIPKKDGQGAFDDLIPKNSVGKSIRDTALDLASGVLDIPKQAYGLTNVATGGYLDPATRTATGAVMRGAAEIKNAVTGSTEQGPTNDQAPSVARLFNNANDALSGMQSDYRHALEQKRQDAVQNANGPWEETKAAIGQTLSNPSLLAGDIVRSAPSMFLPAVAGRTVATKFGGAIADQAMREALAGGATEAAARAAGEKAVNEAAERAVIATTGIAQVGGGNNIDTINQVEETKPEAMAANPQYQALLAQGLSDTQARDELARKAGLLGAAIAAPISLAASKFSGAGGQLAKVATGRYEGKTLRDLGVAVTKEMLQEYPESFGEQLGQNVGAQQYGDQTTDPTKGAWAAAAEGALAGAGMGAGEHVIGHMLHGAPHQDAPQTPPPPAGTTAPDTPAAGNPAAGNPAPGTPPGSNPANPNAPTAGTPGMPAAPAASAPTAPESAPAAPSAPADPLAPARAALTTLVGEETANVMLASNPDWSADRFSPQFAGKTVGDVIASFMPHTKPQPEASGPLTAAAEAASGTDAAGPASTLFPWTTAQNATRHAMNDTSGRTFDILPHPLVDGRFAAIPSDQEPDAFRTRGAAQAFAEARADTDGAPREVVDHPNFPGYFALAPQKEADDAARDVGTGVPASEQRADRPDGAGGLDGHEGNRALGQQQPGADGTGSAAEQVHAGETGGLGDDAGAVAPGSYAPASSFEQAAQQAHSSESNDLQASDAQIRANNAKLGHGKIAGHDISVENDIGSVREGTDPETGEIWQNTLQDTYGYVKGVPARAPDKEHVDVFVKRGTPDDWNGNAYIVDQNKADGSFDEPKVVLGAASLEEAKDTYLRNYSPEFAERIRGIREVSNDALKAMLQQKDSFDRPQPAYTENRQAPDIDAGETAHGLEVDRADLHSLEQALSTNTDPATGKPIHSEGRRIELQTERENLRGAVQEASDYLNAHADTQTPSTNLSTPSTNAPDLSTKAPTVDTSTQVDTQTPSARSADHARVAEALSRFPEGKSGRDADIRRSLLTYQAALDGEKHDGPAIPSDIQYDVAPAADQFRGAGAGEFHAWATSPSTGEKVGGFGMTEEAAKADAKMGLYLNLHEKQEQGTNNTQTPSTDSAPKFRPFTEAEKKAISTMTLGMGKSASDGLGLGYERLNPATIKSLRAELLKRDPDTVRPYLGLWEGGFNEKLAKTEEKPVVPPEAPAAKAEKETKPTGTVADAEPIERGFHKDLEDVRQLIGPLLGNSPLLTLAGAPFTKVRVEAMEKLTQAHITNKHLKPEQATWPKLRAELEGRLGLTGKPAERNAKLAQWFRNGGVVGGHPTEDMNRLSALADAAEKAVEQARARGDDTAAKRLQHKADEANAAYLASIHRVAESGSAPKAQESKPAEKKPSTPSGADMQAQIAKLNAEAKQDKDKQPARTLEEAKAAVRAFFDKQIAEGKKQMMTGTDGVNTFMLDRESQQKDGHVQVNHRKELTFPYRDILRDALAAGPTKQTKTVTLVDDKATGTRIAVQLVEGSDERWAGGFTAHVDGKDHAVAPHGSYYSSTEATAYALSDLKDVVAPEVHQAAVKAAKLPWDFEAKANMGREGIAAARKAEQDATLIVEHESKPASEPLPELAKVEPTEAEIASGTRRILSAPFFQEGGALMRPIKETTDSTDGIRAVEAVRHDIQKDKPASQKFNGIHSFMERDGHVYELLRVWNKDQSQVSYQASLIKVWDHKPSADEVRAQGEASAQRLKDTWERNRVQSAKPVKPAIVPNDQRLLLISCSDSKLAGTHPAKSLYTGALHQMLRKWMPAKSPELYVISAKHGLVHGEATLTSYDQKMDAERAQELAARPLDLSSFAGKTFHDVFVAGSEQYRAVAQAYLQKLQAAGIVAPDATINMTTGGIGDQRGQLGDYLRAIGGTEKGATEKAQPKPAKTSTPAKDRVRAADPFLALLAEHGVAMKLQSDLGLEKGNRGNRMVPGFGPVLRHAGANLDELANAARDAGFITQADIDDAIDTGAVKKLTDMIYRAVANREIITPLDRVDDAAQSEYDRRIENELRAQADGLGIDHANLSLDELIDVVDAKLADNIGASAEEYDAIQQAADELQDRISDDELDRALEAALNNQATQQELTDEEIDRLFAGPASQRPAAETFGPVTGATGEGAEAHQGAAHPENAQSAPQLDDFALAGQTTEEGRAAIAAEEARQAAQAKAELDARRRELADRERDTFTLTGSDRPADVLAAQGQTSIFDAPAQPAEAAQPAKAEAPALDADWKDHPVAAAKVPLKLPASSVVNAAIAHVDGEANFRRIAQAHLDDLAQNGYIVPKEEVAHELDMLADEILRDAYGDKGPKYQGIDSDDFPPKPGMEDAEIDDPGMERMVGIFPAPAKTVNAVKQAAGQILTREQAQAKLAEWKAEAKRIGETNKNANKVILSLFDASGVWSQPYADAGYTVIRYDLAHGDNLVEHFPMHDIVTLRAAGMEIAGVIAQPPCTSFSNAGRWSWPSQHDTPSQFYVEKKYGEWATRYFDKPIDVADTLGEVAKLVVEFASPTEFYVLENPRGRIAERLELPASTMVIQPHVYGNPYTKETHLYGEFQTDLPTANVSPKEEDGGEGSKVWKLRGTNADQKALRSLTPEGFAYAFFMANHDKPAIAPKEAFTKADAEALDRRSEAQRDMSRRIVQELLATDGEIGYDQLAHRLGVNSYQDGPEAGAFAAAHNALKADGTIEYGRSGWQLAGRTEAEPAAAPATEPEKPAKPAAPKRALANDAEETKRFALMVERKQLEKGSARTAKDRRERQKALTKIDEKLAKLPASRFTQAGTDDILRALELGRGGDPELTTRLVQNALRSEMAYNFERHTPSTIEHAYAELEKSGRAPKYTLAYLKQFLANREHGFADMLKKQGGIDKLTANNLPALFRAQEKLSPSVLYPRLERSASALAMYLVDKRPDLVSAIEKAMTDLGYDFWGGTWSKQLAADPETVAAHKAAWIDLGERVDLLLPDHLRGTEWASTEVAAAGEKLGLTREQAWGAHRAFVTNGETTPDEIPPAAPQTPTSGLYSRAPKVDKYAREKLPSDQWTIFKRDHRSLNAAEQQAFDAFLKDRPDGKRVLAQLNQHAGTPWAKQALEGIFVRQAALAYMKDERPAFLSMLEHHQARDLRAILGKRGVDGLMARLDTTGYIGSAEKPLNNVSGSFSDCNPSDDCATYCYATNANYERTFTVIKSELIKLAIERNPQAAAERTVKEYDRTTAGQNRQALRLFDKGDGSNEWLPFIRHLNQAGVRTQIFSKNPEFLRQVPDINLRLLSIDNSNLGLADANPDLKVAFVYDKSPGQVDMLARLLARDQIGVVLPIQQGKKVLGAVEFRELKDAVPGIGPLVCPIDIGIKKLGTDIAHGEWNCTACDKDGALGCFYGNPSKQVLDAANKLPPSPEDLAREAEQLKRQLYALSQKYEALVAAPGAGGDLAATGRDAAARISDIRREIEQRMDDLFSVHERPAEDAVPQSGGAGNESPDRSGQTREGDARRVIPIAKARDANGKPLASRTALQDSGYAVSSLAAHLAPIVASWKNPPAGGIHAVQSVSDLPTELLSKIPTDVLRDLRGVYDPVSQAVYLVADRIANAAEAEFVLGHEVLGHVGLRTLMGEEELGRELDRLRNLNPALAAAARDQANRFGVDLTLATEEALSDWQGEGRPLKGWQGFMAKIQAALRAIGLGRVADWLESKTQAETLSLLAQARTAITGRENKAPRVFGATEALRYSSDRSPLFRSALAEAVDKMPMKAAPAAQWLNALNGLSSRGVKADEIYWSGVREWLATQDGKVTKAAVQDFLAQNSTKVATTILGDEDPALEAARAKFIDDFVDERRQAHEETVERDVDTRMEGIFGSNYVSESTDDDGETVWDHANEYAGTVDTYRTEEEAQNAVDEANDAERDDAEREIRASMPEFDEDDARRDAEREWESDHDDNDLDTQFSKWRTVPGGDPDTYRELLIHMPKRSQGQVLRRTAIYNQYQPKIDALEKDMHQLMLSPNPDDRNRANLVSEQIGELMRQRDLEARAAAGETDVFNGDHWEHGNVLAHVRFDVRDTPDGKRVLQLHEIQSDWAEQGRSKGFQDERAKQLLDLRAQMAELGGRKGMYDKMAALEQAYEARTGQKAFNDAYDALPGFDKSDEGRAWNRLADLISQRRKLEQGTDNTLPTAPFVKKTEAWVALALKRAIRYAADHGMDYVALPTGDQANQIFSLERQVTIDYQRKADGRVWLHVARADNGSTLTERTVPLEELPGIVGKEVAQKIERGEGQASDDTTLAEIKARGEPTGIERGPDNHLGENWFITFADPQQRHGAYPTKESAERQAEQIRGMVRDGQRLRLEGDDLKVGGEPMRKYYDGMVVNIANDILKKFGGERVAPMAVSSEPGLAESYYAQREETNMRTQPGFAITPKLRDAALSGLPLFSQRDPAPVPRVDEERQRAKPGANVERLAGLLGPQLYGDMTKMGPVTVKELFQNSFDALKGALEKGLLSHGAIDIATDPTSRTITISDNGTGMTPDVINKAFLTIAGTNKETERSSGGFGIAKMLFLFGNDFLHLTTVRDGVEARLETSGQQLMASFNDESAAPEIVTRKTDAANGTTITVRVPQSFRNPSTGTDERIDFPASYELRSLINDSPLFENISVKLNGDTMPVGDNFPKDEFTTFSKANFDWGSARIIVSKQEDKSVWGSNVKVLSNGLYQFGFKISENPFDAMSGAIPRRFYINVEPRVKPEEPGYPFALNRQGFSPAVREDFDKITRYLSVLYGANKAAESAAGFGQVEYVNPDNSVSEKLSLAPQIDAEARSNMLHIHEGDQIAIHNGRMVVNGREVPELTRADLDRVKVDVSKLKIAQSEVDPSRPMVHDNIDLKDDPAANAKLAAAEAKLAELKAAREAAENAFQKVSDEWGAATDKYGYNSEEAKAVQERSKELDRAQVDAINAYWNYKSGEYEHEVNAAKDAIAAAPLRPVTDIMRARFGRRFDAYLGSVGRLFMQLRDAVHAEDERTYRGMENVPVGVSFDEEYFGVHFTTPFRGMFVNPAITQLDDAGPLGPRASTKRIANAMLSTMIHEIAHFAQMNHSTSFISEMQRVTALLESSDNFNLANVRQELRSVLDRHHDIYTALNLAFRGQNLSNRGVKLADAGSYDARHDRPADELAGAGAAGKADGRVAGPVTDRADAGVAGANDQGTGEPAAGAGDLGPLYSRRPDEPGSPGRRSFLLGLAAAALHPQGALAASTLSRVAPVSPAILARALPLNVAAILRAKGGDHVNGMPVLKAALRALAETGPRETRDLAAKIFTLLPESNLRLTVDDKHADPDYNAFVKLKVQPLHMTLYTAKGATGMTVGTLLHESLHVAVAARYSTLKNPGQGTSAPMAAKALAQFGRVHEEFQKVAIPAVEAIEAKMGPRDRQSQLDVSLANAITSPDEFFVRALTDETLQAWMAKQPYEGKTLWERFKSWVKSALFGVKDANATPSWLDAALVASEDLLRAMPLDAPDYSRLTARQAELARTKGDQPSMAPGEGPLYSRGRETIGAIADTIRSGLSLRKIADHVRDLFKSYKDFNNFNFYDKSLSTQYNKAKKDADFRAVFEPLLQQVDDTAHYAIEAESLAPDVLIRLEGVKNVLGAIFKGGKDYEADMAAISKPLFDHIEGEQGVRQVRYTPHELATIYGLNPQQIAMYEQVRNAVDTSIDRLAQTWVLSIGRGQGVDIQPLRDADLHDTAAQVKEGIAQAHQEAILRLQGYAQQQGVPLTPERVLQLEAARDALLERIDGIVEKADFLKMRAYMPAMRFGHYFVMARDPQAQPDTPPAAFNLYKSQFAAHAAARQLAEQHPEWVITKGVLNDERYKMFKGVSPETVELFAMFSGMNQDQAYQDYIALARSARAVAKHEINRQGVAGFSQNVPQVIAHFLLSNARQSAINVNSGDINAALARPELAKKGDVQKEAQELVHYIANPEEEAPGLRNFMFHYFIGGSVASAMANLTQPVLQTLPWLTEHVGAKAPGLLLAAARMAATGRIDDPHLAAALKQADADGLTQPKEIHTLMADAQQGLITANVRARALLQAWSGFFGQAEAFNRRATFLSAYQAALELGVQAVRDKGYKDAYDFARAALNETQGLYSKVNRPNWARGGAGSVLFTFKLFSITYLEMLMRMPWQQKLIALALMTTMAGVEGWPFIENIEDMVDTLGQAMGYNVNSKKAVRRLVTGVFGDTFGPLMLRGGFGALDADMSGKLGLGKLIPGTGTFKLSDKDKDGGDAGGPAESMFKAFHDAVMKAQLGQFGGNSGAFATLAPTAVRNMIAGTDMWTSGHYHDSMDRNVMPATKYEAALKFFGFQPSSVALQTDILGDISQDKAMLGVLKGSLMTRWGAAIMDQDQAAIQKIVAQWQQWNQDNPQYKLVITPAELQAKVRQMVIERDVRTIKNAPKVLRAEAVQEMKPQ